MNSHFENWYDDLRVLYTSAQMREHEAAVMDAGEWSALDMMDMAGQGVVDAMRATWPGCDGRDALAVILCGPGNNGGDGYVVARLLRLRGWRVAVFAYGDDASASEAAQVSRDRWTAVGTINRLDPSLDQASQRRALHRAFGYPGKAAFMIDAVFGIGLTRRLDEAVHQTWRSLGQAVIDFMGSFADGFETVAIDVPSGLCADSGRVLAEGDEGGGWASPLCVASLTVTFHAPKPGHILDRGARACGTTWIADIGLWPRTPKPTVSLVEGAEPHRLEKSAGHKYGYGHAVILSGGCGKGGAARLSARACLRVGAGLVTLAVPPAALQENAARLDAVMLRSVRNAEALAGHLEDDRVNAFCAGPGLGHGEAQGALVATLLGLRRPTVLDADALTLVSKDPALRGALHADCVLTPHEGEFARLFPEISERLNAPPRAGPAYSKVDATRDAAGEAGCVVLLKGPDTVIAAPGGRAAISAAVHERAAPWLATAGTGDVLAGFVTGLMARGFAPFDAACTAAWLHVECALEFGPGLIAEDLPDQLPKVFRRLGL